MNEIIKDAAQTTWAVIRPFVMKGLSYLLAAIVLYVLLFKVVGPWAGDLVTGFFSAIPTTKAELKEQVVQQKEAINELRKAGETNQATISDLKGSAVITDAEVKSLLQARNDERASTDKINDKYRATVTTIKVDQALAKQNTKNLLEKRNNQKNAGESTEHTDLLIEQSRLAAEILGTKYAEATIDTIWESYENARK